MKLIILVALINAINGVLVIVPENIAVIEGTSVFMKCRTNDTNKTVVWRALLDENHPQKISIGTQLTQAAPPNVYQINNTLEGQYDLKITTRLSVAKQYICQEGPFGHLYGQMSSADVVVLASEPNCTVIGKNGNKTIIIYENQTAEFLCRVSFAGNWTPVSEWLQDTSTNITTATAAVVSETNTKSSIISIMTIHGKITDNQTKYTFLLKFDKSSKPSSTTAENVPNYSFKWTSPTVIVIGNDVTSGKDSITRRHSEDQDSENGHSLGITVSVTLLLIVLMLPFLVILLKFKCKGFIRKHEKTNTQLAANVIHLRSYDLSSPVSDIVNDLENREAVETEPQSSRTQSMTQPPIYATINNSPESIYCLKKEYDTFPKSNVSQQRVVVVGADGTEYIRLSSAAAEANQPKEQLFHTSQYAKIDHSVCVP